MTRGTTPLHIFTLPQRVKEYDNFIITYRQNNGTVIEKTPASTTIEGNQIKVRLSAEETLKFDSGQKAFVQIKVAKDKIISASAIFSFPVNAILDETPLTPSEDLIEVVRGTSHTFRISILDEFGQPYVMQPGEILRMGVKDEVDAQEYVLEKEVDYTFNIGGEYIIILQPSDTLFLDCKKYWYDVGLQSGVDYFMVIECSPFVVRQNITSVEGE